jgi:hypothetical protein
MACGKVFNYKGETNKGHENHYCNICRYSSYSLYEEESPCFSCLGAKNRDENENEIKCNWRKQ